MLPTVETKYDIVVDLGNKKIKARKWKGKDRISFENTDPKDMDDFNRSSLELLVLNNLEDKDKGKYYSLQELLLILIHIRSASISDDVSFKYICNECQKVNDETVSVKSIPRFKPNDFKSIDAYGYTFTINDGLNKDFYLKQIADTDLDPDFIEMVLRISSVSFDGTTYDVFKFEEMVTFLTNLDSEVFDKLVKDFYDAQSDIDLMIERTCGCGHKTIVEFDEIPEFFGDWAV